MLVLGLGYCLLFCFDLSLSVISNWQVKLSVRVEV